MATRIKQARNLSNFALIEFWRVTDILHKYFNAIVMLITQTSKYSRYLWKDTSYVLHNGLQRNSFGCFMPACNPYGHLPSLL